MTREPSDMPTITARRSRVSPLLADLALRAWGAALLFAAGKVANGGAQQFGAASRHAATPLAFGVFALAFALLTAGLAFIVEGRGLFRQVPIPYRARHLDRASGNRVSTRPDNFALLQE